MQVFNPKTPKPKMGKFHGYVGFLCFSGFLKKKCGKYFSQHLIPDNFNFFKGISSGSDAEYFNIQSFNFSQKSANFKRAKITFKLH